MGDKVVGICMEDTPKVGGGEDGDRLDRGLGAKTRSLELIR